MNKLIQRSFLNVLATVAYIAIVATIMKNGERIFGQMDNAFSPIAFLTLLVLSATITGSLILGKPILMYLNDSKPDAIKLFLYTLGWLAIATIVLFLIIVSLK